MQIRLLLFSILLACESLACLAAFTLWQKWKGTPFRMYATYLLLVVVVEGFSFFLNLNHVPPTHELAQIRSALYKYLVIPAEFLSAFAVFYFTSKRRQERLLAACCAATYILAFIGDALFHLDQKVPFYTGAYSIGCALILILVLRFLFRLAISENILEFQRDILFWFCAGWLLFYVGALPYYGMENTLTARFPVLVNSYLLVGIYVLNFLMYLLIAVGYIWGKPK